MNQESPDPGRENATDVCRTCGALAYPPFCEHHPSKLGWDEAPSLTAAYATWAERVAVVEKDPRAVEVRADLLVALLRLYDVVWNEIGTLDPTGYVNKPGDGIVCLLDFDDSAKYDAACEAVESLLVVHGRPVPVAVVEKDPR